MSRIQIAAGNWKMNTTFKDGIELGKTIADQALVGDNGLVILAPPFTHLQAVGQAISHAPKVKLAAQNCHVQESGAYTGEISIDMLMAVGVEYVILGHSERREYFAESNELLAQKVNLVLSKGLQPIFCCGESLDIREAGTHVEYVAKQLEEGLFHLTAEQFGQIVIAYEPIWAIGTGVTASPQQAQDMQESLRGLIANAYNKEVAEQTSILYGGSVKPGNAVELFGQPDVDGGLVGGASLKADDFLAIIAAL